MKACKIFAAFSFLLILLAQPSPGQSPPPFDIQAYRVFLQQNQNLTAQGLQALYPSGRFESEATAPATGVPWQEYPFTGTNIMYGIYRDGTWGQPLFLTTQGAGDQMPHVAPWDSGAGCVWERQGRILYSRYDNGVWSTPESVTPPGDTLNSRPQLHYTRSSPVVVWAKRKSPDTTFAVMVSSK